MNWNNKTVLVTGGASFIGSHLVDALVEKGAQIRVVENLNQTADWYFQTKKREEVGAALQRGLTERDPA